MAAPQNPRGVVVLEPISCNDVRWEGFTVTQGGNWATHPTYCTDVVIKNINITGDRDGIDVDSCKNVRIEGCDINTGDDCISLKSGRGLNGARIGKPTQAPGAVALEYEDWLGHQRRLTDPEHDKGLVGKVRSLFDNTEDRIRPEVAGHADRPTRRRRRDLHHRHRHVDGVAVPLRDDARHPPTARLLQPRLDGQRDAAGARRGRARPRRQVVAFCGDGGLTMLLGDLLTAVADDLPVKLIVFDNGRLGHGQTRAGTRRAAGVRHGADQPRPGRRGPARWACPASASAIPEQLEAAVAEALAAPGPVLLDVVTNPEEIALPPKTSIDQAWGFAIAKVKEGVVSRGAKA